MAVRRCLSLRRIDQIELVSATLQAEGLCIGSLATLHVHLRVNIVIHDRRFTGGSLLL